MMIRSLISTVALAGLVTTASAFDSTEDRLVNYGFASAPIESSQVVDTVQVSYGSVGLDQAVALKLLPARTEVGYIGHFERQSAPQLTTTEQRLQEMGFRADPLSFRSTPNSQGGSEVAQQTGR